MEEEHVSSDEFDDGNDCQQSTGSNKPCANGDVTEEEKLNDVLGLRSGATVDDIIKVSLLNPVKYVTSNHGKRIRGKLVTLSYRLLAEGSTPSHAEAVQCGICAEVVELIH